MDGASTGRCYKEELRKRMEEAKSENCLAKLVATRWNDNDLRMTVLSGYQPGDHCLLVPSRAHRYCMSSSFQRKFIN